MLLESFTSCGLLLFALFTVLKFLKRLRLHDNQLPGPTGLPFIGHIFSLTKEPWRKFLQWKRAYGGIVGISVAGFRIVVVSDSATLLEVNSRPEVLGVLNMEFLKKQTIRRGGEGMIFSVGKSWQDGRNFVLQSFTEFGSRGSKIADGISSECRKLVMHLKEREGAPTSLEHLFQQYTLNAIWGTVAKETFTPEGTEIVLNALKANSVFDSPLDWVAVLFPSFFDRFTTVLKWRSEAAKTLRKLLSTRVEQHLIARLPGQPRDMIDKFQDVVDATTDPDSIFHATRQSIVPIMTDISLGAVDTSATMMHWLVLYCLQYPYIQTKVQAEISKVIGQDRHPAYSDQAHMPFTEAVILEALRIHPPGPFGFPRNVLTDFTIQGKLIPRGAILVPNLIGMNHDPSVWENPEEFKPERFLTTDGTLSSDMKKKVCSFSIGKRQCPGERFARETLFLMFTNLLQNFDLSTNETACFDATNGFLATPSKPISVSFKSRAPH